MKEKRIAILMSTYNGEKYITEQINSIINQKCEYQIDIFVRDDGSTDRTLNILYRLQLNYDSIHITSGINIGYNASFFTLLKLVNGYDYYAFSDQDDVWLNDKLQTAIDILEQKDNESPLLYGSCSILVNEDLKPMGLTQQKKREVTFFNTIIQNFIPGHSQVMNEALHMLLTKDIDYTRIYVYDAWITNVAIIEGDIIVDNEPHAYYRIHSNNGFGFGIGSVGWFIERFRRISGKSLKEYAKQIDYFVEVYGQDLKPAYAAEMLRFQTCKETILSRIAYITRTKLYRQETLQTQLFRILYLLNQY